MVRSIRYKTNTTFCRIVQGEHVHPWEGGSSFMRTQLTLAKTFETNVTTGREHTQQQQKSDKRIEKKKNEIAEHDEEKKQGA